jgi:hypothetical protein
MTPATVDPVPNEKVSIGVDLLPIPLTLRSPNDRPLRRL